jgi:hypothetical protein
VPLDVNEMWANEVHLSVRELGQGIRGIVIGSVDSVAWSAAPPLRKSSSIGSIRVLRRLRALAAHLGGYRSLMLVLALTLL